MPVDPMGPKFQPHSEHVETDDSHETSGPESLGNTDSEAVDLMRQRRIEQDRLDAQRLAAEKQLALDQAAAAQKIQAISRGKVDRQKAEQLKEIKAARDAADWKALKAGTKGTNTDGTTPTPLGLPSSAMKLNGLNDMNVAFKMLDASKRGALSREQARKWFRCLGWCAPDHKLDVMLNMGRPASVAQTWTLAILAKIAQENSSRSNCSVETLQTALRMLAGNKPRISKQRLIEIMTGYADLKPEAQKDIFQALGVATTGSMDCDTLAYNVLQSICQPPSAVDFPA